MLTITRSTKPFFLRQCKALAFSSLKSYSSDKNDKESKSLDLSSLFDDNKTNIKPNQSLQSLLGNIKSKKGEGKHLKNEQIKERDKRNRKQGEQFLFQKSKLPDNEKVSNKEKDENVDQNIDLVEKNNLHSDDVGEETAGLLGINKEVSFNTAKLKEDLNHGDDNRDVSKLMTALINDIDDKVENPEEKLKTLMKVMSKRSLVDKPTSLEEGSKISFTRNRRKTSHRKFDFSFGPSTNLFLSSSEDTSPSEVESDQEYISLSERKWNEDLYQLLPEAVPQNSFEKIMLTIDKQWEFPIDNNQDMGVEEETSFEEHVFLDHHLDNFPEKGPIRHFMELVVTGLQQNPHLSVVEKEERILYYKNYFDKFSDEDLLNQ